MDSNREHVTLEQGDARSPFSKDSMNLVTFQLGVVLSLQNFPSVFKFTYLPLSHSLRLPLRPKSGNRNGRPHFQNASRPLKSNITLVSNHSYSRLVGPTTSFPPCLRVPKTFPRLPTAACPPSLSL